jgi:2-amino-4-hydroxy-6-hydroxymethyldihydropteridine diphosphokinase
MGRVVVAVALGSNIEPRDQHLAYARRRLSELLTDARFSSIHETAPVGVSVAQGDFLNQAAAGETTLSARHLLDALLAIERDAGRARPFPAAPRTLDLDLILYGDLTIDEPGLTVPHPRFRSRAFVLDPLSEIVPSLLDPVSRLTIDALRRRLRQEE